MFLLKKVCTSGREEIFSILRKSISLPKYTLLRSTLEIVTKKRHTIEFHSLRIGRNVHWNCVTEGMVIENLIKHYKQPPRGVL